MKQSEFVGYDQLQSEATVVTLLQEGAISQTEHPKATKFSSS